MERKLEEGKRWGNISLQRYDLYVVITYPTRTLLSHGRKSVVGDEGLWWARKTGSWFDSVSKNHVPKTMYVQYIQVPVPILFIYTGNGGENLSLVYIIITSKFSKILYWGKLDCNKGEFSYLT